MKRYLPLAALLVLVLAACGEPPPAVEANLGPDQSALISLPPSGAAYVRLKNISGPTRAYAQTVNPRGPGLRLVLLNEDLAAMYASSDLNWFGVPNVALAGKGTKPLITPTLTDGVRLNFEATFSYDYYLRVENHSNVLVEVEVGVTSFTPNPNGDFFSGDTLALGESKTGAIELVDEEDAYVLTGFTGTAYLHLTASGASKTWLVADVYESDNPRAKLLRTLEPDGLNCTPVSAGYFILLRTHGNAVAGFDEPDSLQYTLTLDTTACP